MTWVFAPSNTAAPLAPSGPDTSIVSSFAGCPTGSTCANVPVDRFPATKTLVEPPWRAWS